MYRHAPVSYPFDIWVVLYEILKEKLVIYCGCRVMIAYEEA